MAAKIDTPPMKYYCKKTKIECESNQVSRYNYQFSGNTGN